MGMEVHVLLRPLGSLLGWFISKNLEVAVLQRLQQPGAEATTAPSRSGLFSSEYRSVLLIDILITFGAVRATT